MDGRLPSSHHRLTDAAPNAQQATHQSNWPHTPRHLRKEDDERGQVVGEHRARLPKPEHEDHPFQEGPRQQKPTPGVQLVYPQAGAARESLQH
eukprot:11388555-Prorocentrum_lima.AAC.1